MFRNGYHLPIVLGLILTVVTTTALAQSTNLRITEIDPDGDEVEVTNTGGAFNNTSTRFFCHRFNYISTIGTGSSHRMRTPPRRTLSPAASRWMTETIAPRSAPKFIVSH